MPQRSCSRALSTWKALVCLASGPSYNRNSEDWEEDGLGGLQDCSLVQICVSVAEGKEEALARDSPSPEAPLGGNCALLSTRSQLGKLVPTKV